MDSKEHELFTSVWSLLLKHQELLGDVLPVIGQIVVTLQSGSLPTPQQLFAWTERYGEMTRRLDALTEHVLSLRQAADPLFRFDA